MWTTILTFALGGCSGSGGRCSYQTPAGVKQQNSLAAQSINEEGLERIKKGDLPAAERKFREALELDLYCVSAHNNLGLVLHQQGRHYEAAWEFHHAAKLLPDSAEPRTNLGILYEDVGRLSQAQEQYEQALALQPNDLNTMRYLARVRIKQENRDERTQELLKKLMALPQDEPQWDYWLRGQMVRLGRE